MTPPTIRTLTLNKPTMEDSSGCGCGCLSLILTFILMMFLVWLIFFGVSTPWGKYEIDVFPPTIKKVYPNFNH